ncbi:MAG: diguanylate cyclase [Actinobacteria bacterium]|nr:diguanylate cyclase [Actinomycetota bacterium]
MRPFLLAPASRRPGWPIHLALAGATLGIAGAVAGSGDASSPFPVLYVPLVAAAFSMLPRVAAAIHACFAAAVYAAAVSLFPGTHAVAGGPRFAVLAVTLFVGAALLNGLRTKHRDLARRIRDLRVTEAGPALLDRRGMDDVLAVEAERARRSGVRFALVAAAADGEPFDALSPAAAERAPLVARAVTASILWTDFAGRIGPNLFCVLAIYTDERGAEALVERIRTALGKADATEGHPPLSFGIAIYGRNGQSPAALLNAAESALDAARRLGGQRSIIAPRTAEAGGDPKVRIAAAG